jgi:hypothetical protein
MPILAACAFEEIQPEANSDQQKQLPADRAIVFNSAAYRPNTKAAIIDGNNIRDFKVSANLPHPSFLPKGAVTGETGFNFFEHVNVLRQADDHWAYSPNLYWTNDSDSVSFYAYSPAASVNMNGFYSHMMTADSTDDAIIDYILPTSPVADAQNSKLPEDLLVALTKQDKAKGDTVKLTFHHALSMATFAARNTTNDLDVTIEKVQLINLATHGTLNLSKDFRGDSVYWDGQNSQADYTAGIPRQTDGSYAISLPPRGMGSSYISLTGPTEEMPVLPQGFYVDPMLVAHVLKKGKEPVPAAPGILVTFRAKTAYQVVASSGTQAFYPFPAYYKQGQYGGTPNVSGSGSLDAFAFQMGKRYQFTFDFDGSAFPKINFQTTYIDDYSPSPIVPQNPTLRFFKNGTELRDPLEVDIPGEAQKMSVAEVLTNQPSWTAELLSGTGWLTLDASFGYSKDSLRITTTENMREYPRTAQINIYAGTMVRTITIKQDVTHDE